MPKFKGKERRKVSRYRVTDKVHLIAGAGNTVHTIPAELRSIGLGGALVRVLGAFAQRENLSKGGRFIFTIIGDGPLKGITAGVTVRDESPGAYGSQCINLAFDGELEDVNRAAFMRWRTHQSAIGRMMPSSPASMRPS
ncbi:hypothetical protein HY624_03555 [Candidatus Uhrbacteria bacterium]|nr:hypothetical protein [Candidatus Uhrbacteria bacterium]